MDWNGSFSFYRTISRLSCYSLPFHLLLRALLIDKYNKKVIVIVMEKFALSLRKIIGFVSKKSICQLLFTVIHCTLAEEKVLSRAIAIIPHERVGKK